MKTYEDNSTFLSFLVLAGILLGVILIYMLF
jgi:hypothetical protein